uniref:Ferrochelatase n=1 Tax=Strongyloides venezuelensis TaxID=75913 RepID=A0A0K0G1I8_STRVS
MKPLLLRFTRSLASKISLPKTTVLLIHNGQPRTLYYAREFLSKQLIEHEKLPSLLAEMTVDKYLKMSKNIVKCMEEYTEDLEISNYLDTLSKNIENKLTQNAPFGKPYKINYSFTFPVSDKDYSIKNSLMNMISKDGTQRLIVLPLHPTCSSNTNEYLKNKIDKFMMEHTELIDEENTNFKVVKNYPVSFDYSFINEWFNESFIVNYWSKRLKEICNNPEEVPDMIIFTTSCNNTSDDKNNFIKNYKNICGDIIKNVDYPSPWRSTFYYPWDFLVSLKIIKESNLTTVIKEHQKKGKNSIVIVPIFDFIPTFNTTTILPQLASQSNVRLLEATNSVEFLSTNFSDIIERELVN